MREIKFRAWDVAEKMMCHSIDDCNLEMVLKGVISHDGETFTEAHYMQFTGLRDKNGVEIYEGDVVKHKEWGYLYGKESIVEYSEGGFYPFADTEDNAPYPEPNESEVIGNIYEHGDLLNG